MRKIILVVVLLIFVIGCGQRFTAMVPELAFQFLKHHQSQVSYGNGPWMILCK